MTRFYLLLGLLLLAGCSTFTIDTRYDKDYRYSELRSFGWSNLAPDITGDAEYARPEVDEAIRVDLARAFEARGFRAAGWRPTARWRRWPALSSSKTPRQAST